MPPDPGPLAASLRHFDDEKKTTYTQRYTAWLLLCKVAVTCRRWLFISAIRVVLNRTSNRMEFFWPQFDLLNFSSELPHGHFSRQVTKVPNFLFYVLCILTTSYFLSVTRTNYVEHLIVSNSFRSKHFFVDMESHLSSHAASDLES